jgi:hypothetical protein
VLFLPAGIYRITRTLNLGHVINVSVVGEDPGTTSIVWDGEAGGTMLAVDGVAYSRFIRLTFDGRRTASIAVDQSWTGSKEHFDTGNEYADDRFVDVEYGIRGGFRGHGFAETSILRSQFLRNTVAGVAHGNFNALDTWVWYSLFDDCGVGVTNGGGAGNFHVYNSVFRNSRTSDLYMGNTGGFSVRGSYSSGSRAFFLSDGNTNHPATIHLQGNTILDPQQSTAISFGNQGPGLIVDNVLGSMPGASGPVIDWTSFFGADVVSIGNTFTTAGPYRVTGRMLSVDDRVVPRASVSPEEPALPGPLPNLHRRVVEVAAGADASAIRNAITAAAASSGTRPVVHIPAGVYEIAQTLTVPPGDLQIVGDGYGTVLTWTGEGSGPVMRVGGPSQAAIREIQIDGANRADGLVVDNVDQPGARVYAHQLQLRAARSTGLSISGLDHAYVHLEDIGHAYSPDAVMVKVVGGPLSAAGQSTMGRTNVFSGASSGSRISYEVSGGGRLLVRDLWYESGAGPGFARVHGRAEFTADGVRVSSPANGPVPAIDIAGVNGRVAILAAHLDDRISVSGTGANADVLGLAIFCEQRFAQCFEDRAEPPADVVVLNSRQIGGMPGTRSAQAGNIGLADPEFVRMMLAHARRERPAVLQSLPRGVTDVRMFRVWVANGVNNVALEAR